MPRCGARRCPICRFGRMRSPSNTCARNWHRANRRRKSPFLPSGHRHAGRGREGHRQIATARHRQKPANDQSLLQAIRHLPADKDTADVLMGILQDKSKPIAARALIPDIVNNVDPSGFAASREMEARGTGRSQRDCAIPGGRRQCQPGKSQGRSKTKTLIRSLIPASPNSFLRAAMPLMSDKTSSDK